MGKSAGKKKLKRCGWCGDDPLLEEYHDKEWGFPEGSDDLLFERMCLQIFQAGLTWKLILRRRPAFRKAFRGFQIAKVAALSDRDVERLLSDETIIRNRLKILAVIENAKRVLRIREEWGSFRAYLDSLPGGLKALQREFKKMFVFMGPEITRMFVMSINKVPPPHDKGCWRH